MEEKFEKFKKHLEDDKKSKSYLNRAKDYEKWLHQHQNKIIETASENDLRGWGSYIMNKHKTRWSHYFYGVLAYYVFIKDEDNQKILKEIINNAPKPSKEKKPTIRLKQFQSHLLQVEKENPKPRHFALLNLLWSEMKLKEIVNLRKSDVNFEKRIILNKYRLSTKEAWKALEKIKPSDITSRNEFLLKFGKRQSEKITQRYLGKYGLTPYFIHKSFEKDLSKEWRNDLFAGSESDSIPSSNDKEIIISGCKPYDAYKLMKNILSRAKKRIYIIDPYVDERTFSLYLEDLINRVEIKLLSTNLWGKSRIIAKKFKKQHLNFKLRITNEIHDRYLIVDNSAWIIGQSLKDAGNKTMSIIELSKSNEIEKVFNDLWNTSKKFP